jgi:hypothetical protein
MREEIPCELPARMYPRRLLISSGIDVLLYDLTSTYFEGEAEKVKKSAKPNKYGYSRNRRPDCKPLILALWFLTKSLRANRADVNTLEEVLEAVERKHGRARWVWVF